MAKVLTTASSVSCGHGQGKVQSSSGAKLKVNGAAVLLKSSIDGKSVNACGIVPAADASATPTHVKCTAVGPPPGVSAGESTKLRAGGSPVMLDTLAGKTNGMDNKVTPLTALAATAGQTKLTAS